MTKEGDCRICKTKTRYHLSRQLCESGAIHIVWACSGCGAFRLIPNHGIYVKRESLPLTDAEVAELPIIMPRWENRCVVCGRRECELHHWAPRSIFLDEADNWPKDYLCDSCHKEWHRRVTPQFLGGPNGLA